VLFSYNNQTPVPPESQLPHSTSFAVCSVEEQSDRRPRPTPSLGFAPFKPP
jgi:hypothetical protein